MAEAATPNAKGLHGLGRRMMLSADAMFPQVSEAGTRLQLEGRALTLLLEGVRTTLITAMIGPALIAWLTLSDIGWVYALAPAVVLYGLSLERFAFLRRAERARTRGATHPRQWLRAITWRTGLSACVVASWGYPVVTVGGDTLVFVILALATIVSASSVTQFCCWPPAMWASFTPILLGLGAQLLLFGQGHELFGAVFSVLLWLTLGMAGLRFARTLHNDMATRLRNESLVRELEDKRAQAEAANAAKSRFFAAASHDLRQPLQAMSLYLSVLQAGRQDADTLARMGECMDALDRMLAVVMDLSRLDAGQVLATPQPMAVQPLLDSLAGMFEGAARLKGLQLRVHRTTAWVSSDPALLERALSNLLANAIRYTARGGVLLGVRRRGVHLVVCVFDTGQGIPDDASETIFEEFVQLDNPERDPTRGVGLGLSTVRRVAALLGHRVVLRSRLWRGSLFALEVPRAEPEPGARPASTRPAPISAPLRGRVLVVEDNAPVRDALLRLLDSWGLQAEAARTAEEASTLIAEMAFDVVLSDWRLPGARDGLSVLREAHERLPGLRLGLLVTGEDVQHLHQAGQTFPVLRKPVRPLRLRALLASRLGGGG